MPAWSLAAPEWVYRFRRLRRAERMDDPRLPKAEREEALRGLALVSGWPGQREPLLQGVLRLLGAPSARRRRLIEVGAGSGHFSLWLRQELARRGHRAEVLATDREAAPGVRKLDALSRHLPEADLYLSNLLLHHLADRDVTRMLAAQAKASRLGLAHYDLQRHWAHFYGAALVIALSPAPRIIFEDGLRSIQQGYTRAGLRALAAPLGPAAQLRWCFPCRWLLTWRRP